MTKWIEIITGQNNLNYVQSKIYDIQPECRFCEEEDETFAHLLLECPVFRQTRSEILLTHNINIEDISMQQILTFANIPVIKNALSFNPEDMDFTI